MGDVVQAAEQRPWIPQRPQRRRPQAGGDPQPLLLAEPHQHAVLDLRKLDRQSRLAARGGACSAGDLHGELLAVANSLGAQVSAVEFGDDRLREKPGGHGTVIRALIDSGGEGHRE